MRVVVEQRRRFLLERLRHLDDAQIGLVGVQCDELIDPLAGEIDDRGGDEAVGIGGGRIRHDAASFISTYQKQGIFEHDPFISLDVEGVGELVRIATERGRRTRRNLKLGICGEHGGDPASITFCQEVGLDYVSCSPYRVPIARLAAAQAVLSGEQGSGTA